MPYDDDLISTSAAYFLTGSLNAFRKKGQHSLLLFFFFFNFHFEYKGHPPLFLKIVLKQFLSGMWPQNHRERTLIEKYCCVVFHLRVHMESGGASEHGALVFCCSQV